MSALQHGILAFLISMLVCVGLVMSGILAFITLRRMHQDRPDSSNDPEPPYTPSEDPAGSLGSFDRPSRWLAIKTSNLGRVQTTFGLHNPTPCSWAEGLASSREHKIFISPPIQGWILVFGSGIPDPSDDVDKSFHFLCRLSRELGHIQFYSMNEVLGHHAWVRAESGRILRAYAWAGQTIWNQGHPTLAEDMAGLRCFDYGDLPVFSLLARDNPSANVERVLMLASRWSIDPTAISEAALRAERGIAGDLR